MSDTYIGPFGRLLPVEDRPDTPQEHESKNVPSRRQIDMSTAPISTIPRLPLPAKLQFGSDPGPSYSDPHRWETSGPASRLPQYGPRSLSNHEKLPSVSQLLTPTTQERDDYLSRYATESPVRHQTSPGPPHRNYHQPNGSHGDVTYLPPTYPGVAQNSASLPCTGEAFVNAPTHRQGSIPISYLPDPDSEHQPNFNHPIVMDGRQPHPGHHRDGLPGVSSSKTHRAELRTVTKPVKKLVGEKNVAGEGPCFIYADGTHVRKTIDGEAVNANWGLTKAGKPRKRLAIACITCREKKIKCEPNEPKCVQCDKSGRECRFQTA